MLTGRFEQAKNKPIQSCLINARIWLIVAFHICVSHPPQNHSFCVLIEIYSNQFNGYGLLWS